MNRGAPSYPDMPPKVGQKTFGGIFIPDMDISPPPYCLSHLAMSAVSKADRERKRGKSQVLHIFYIFICFNHRKALTLHIETIY